MKLTPEQKAFFEYGKARGILAGVRKEFVVSDVVFGISKQESITSFRKNHPLRRRLIRDAWQKRAACRAWQVKERYCGNCQYSDYNEWDVPCCECSHVNIGESIDRWEPRKEEQDND